MEKKLREIISLLDELRGKDYSSASLAGVVMPRLLKISDLALEMLRDLESDPPRKVMSGDLVKTHLNEIWEEMEELKSGIEDFRQWRRDHFVSPTAVW